MVFKDYGVECHDTLHRSIAGAESRYALPLFMFPYSFYSIIEEIAIVFSGKVCKTDFSAFLLTSLRLVMIPAIFAFLVSFTHILRAYP